MIELIFGFLKKIVIIMSFCVNNEINDSKIKKTNFYLF